MDWQALMQAGMVKLRLPPDVFWQLSPAELQLYAGQPASLRPLGRQALKNLEALFPDE